MSSPGPPLQLGISQSIAQAIRQLQRQASREGRGREFLDAIRTAIDRLSHAPMEFGEPLYYLPNLRLRVRCASVRPIYIDFGVLEDEARVFLKSIKLLARQGA
jgi:hypothetical protein